MTKRRPTDETRAGSKGIRSGGSEAVRVKLLGGFSASVGSRTINHNEWRLRKAAALMKVLALAPGHRLHREQAMDLLWPDSGKKAASNNLRYTLHALRRILATSPTAGFRYLTSEDESLMMCPNGELRVDVEAFEEAATTARRAQEPAATERPSSYTQANSCLEIATKSGRKPAARSCEVRSSLCWWSSLDSTRSVASTG